MKSFAKKFLAAMVALAILIPMAAISFAAPAVERIELNIDAITIGVGQKVKTVKPAAYPEGAAAAFTWESADESIAKVSDKGKITGVKKGSTTITIAAGNGVTAEVEVNVVKKGKGVTKIALNKKSASIVRGKSVALKAAFTPAKPKNKTVIWKSSDESVATVDNKGKVAGVSVGSATITAISSSGKSAACRITVTGVKVKKIKLSGISSMLRNETQQLSAAIKPADADNQALKWTSSNKKVAAVDENGVVTAKKKGSVTITAAAKDGSKVKGTFKITVKKGVFTPAPTATPVPSASAPAGTPAPTVTPSPEPADPNEDIFWYTTDTLGQATIKGLKKVPDDGIVVIPDTISGYVVWAIDNYAFEDCDDIIVVDTSSSKNLLRIKYQAFKNCDNLESVIVGDSVVYLESEAFYGCKSLKSVTIGSSVKEIADYLFHHCYGLEEIVIPDTVETLGEYAFRFCSSLRKVDISENVTTISKYAFADCPKLSEVIFGNNVETICEYAFQNCENLQSVALPETLKTIETGAFINSVSLKKITIPDSVTSLGTSAFCGCTALENAVVGDSVEEIGESAFQQTGLASVTIGNSVKSIGDYAFWKCAGLEEIVIPDSVTEIGYAAFEKCSSLVSAEIGNGVENIASNAFMECSSLETVTMGRSVKKIGYYVFQDCTKLTNLTLSEELQSIGNCAFKNCMWLSEVVIPGKVNEIGGGAFYNCVRLLKVVIPETVTGITDGAFDLPSGYYSLMEIHGKAGSYAEEYAKRNGIPFVAME